MQGTSFSRDLVGAPRLIIRAGPAALLLRRALARGPQHAHLALLPDGDLRGGGRHHEHAVAPVAGAACPPAWAPEHMPAAVGRQQGVLRRCGMLGAARQTICWTLLSCRGRLCAAWRRGGCCW